METGHSSKYMENNIPFPWHQEVLHTAHTMDYTGAFLAAGKKKKCWVWCFTKHGSEELQELQAPTMAHCATHNKHLASCAVICGQTLALVATELWQRPKGKGQTMGAETKLDQLIHANLFRSFWCQHDQP